MPLLSHSPHDSDGFRLRGLEMSRIDGFSDVVFGFALTLLVVSLEVPKTYGELHDLIRGFVAFAISFTLLLTVWYTHYQFFRRFGLQDVRTIALNSALLFFVLFYVYPLKFLFNVIGSEMTGSTLVAPMSGHQWKELMVIYGLGFAIIYLLFLALYWNAWSLRTHLQLTPLERILVKIHMADQAASAVIGLLSVIAALLLPDGYSGNAGYFFLLISASKTFFGFYTKRKSDALRPR